MTLGFSGRSVLRTVCVTFISNTSYNKRQFYSYMMKRGRITSYTLLFKLRIDSNPAYICTHVYLNTTGIVCLKIVFFQA